MLMVDFHNRWNPAMRAEEDPDREMRAAGHDHQAHDTATFPRRCSWARHHRCSFLAPTRRPRDVLFDDEITRVHSAVPAPGGVE